MPPKRKNDTQQLTIDDALDEPGRAEAVSEVDPILPLPAGTEIPPVKQGDGDVILSDTHLMIVELPYRAFYSLWEHAERRAAKDYPKYKDRRDGLENYASSLVEAVHAFRSSARGETLPILLEEHAQRLRDEAAEKAKKAKQKGARAEAVLEEAASKDRCPKCSGQGLKKKRNGKKIWKCESCGHRWPRSGHGEAPQSASNGLAAPKSSTDAPKAQSGTQRPRKRPAKKG